MTTNGANLAENRDHAGNDLRGILGKAFSFEHSYNIKEEDEGGTGDDILRSLAHDYQAMKAACTAV